MTSVPFEIGDEFYYWGDIYTVVAIDGERVAIERLEPESVWIGPEDYGDLEPV